MAHQYLEIVSGDSDAVIEFYQRAHGLAFGPPEAELGQARVATRPDGSLVGVRPPLAAHEQPIARAYVEVDDIHRAAATAAELGAIIAYPPTQQGRRGTFAIVIHGGVQHGLWQPSNSTGRRSLRPMDVHTLTDDEGPFEVLVVAASTPTRVVVFAVGGGGDPARHQPLLEALAASGATVVAPRFERMHAPTASEGLLRTRARRLRQALAELGPAGLPVAGVGHSIGAATLVALAGGQMWLGPGHRVAIAPEPRLDRLALLAPATGFFQAPGALDAVTTPIEIWAAGADTITPPAQATYLRDALTPRVAVALHLVDGAGHFSFMHAPPPHIPEPLADRAGFLDQLVAGVCRAVGA